MKKLLVIIVALTISNCSFSQDTNTTKYLPLQVGNVWVYSYSASCYVSGTGSGGGYDKYIISDSLIQSGKKYFILQHYHIQTYGTWAGFYPMLYDIGQPIRVDAFSCNIYKALSCNLSNETLVDSLLSKLNDTAYRCNGPMYESCYDTSTQFIFGTNRLIKSFGWSGVETGYGQTYIKGIGLSYYGYSSLSCGSQTNLVGCVINGIVYGDTSFIVGINQISSEIPMSFSLNQNYPNPFNPNTKIKFQIAKSGNAMLTIYDALGREVTRLVNGQLQPGTYETQWEASNYPSGIYFYKLTVQLSARSERSDGYTETKKMVLIK